MPVTVKTDYVLFSTVCISGHSMSLELQLVPVSVIIMDLNVSLS